jgi:hypothetical protein
LFALALAGAAKAQDSTQTARRVNVLVSNDTSTGTTVNRLAKLTGAPSKAVVAGTSDTDGVIGVVTGGAGGTAAYTSNKLSAFAATTSAELAGVVSDETGSGALAFATGGTLNPASLTVSTATRPTAVIDTTGTTAAGRLHAPVANVLTLAQNASFSGTNWNLDDTAKPGWYFQIDARGAASDAASVSYLSAGANPRTPTTYWQVNASTGVGAWLKGADVASAAAITPTGNLFHVTGTTTITSITSTNVPAGACIRIIFDGALTFTDGSNLKLAGNFVTTADDTISLCYDGSNWYETARAVN